MYLQIIVIIRQMYTPKRM